MDRVATTQVGPDGPIFRIAVDPGPNAQEEDVSALTDVLPFEDLTGSVTAVADAMTGALRRAKPDEAEVTFGIDATIETGRLTSMLVKGAGTATFQVRLLWKLDADGNKLDGSKLEAGGSKPDGDGRQDPAGPS